MPNWRKVITSGSDASLSSLTTSGNISGSATSTGSFGYLQIGDDSNNLGKIAVGVKQPAASGIVAQFQQSDDTRARVATGNASFYMDLKASVSNDTSAQIIGRSGQVILKQRASGQNVELHGGSNIAIVTPTHAISGSSTSTGSFGHLVIAKDAHIGEDVLADGDVVAYNSSDERLKDNIEVIKGSLDKIDGIRGVEFDWNDKSPGWAQERGHDIGVIAQEVQKVIPEIVVERKNGYLGVDYKRLVPLLIESVKELKQEVEILKVSLKENDDDDKNIWKEIEDLKKKVN